MPVGPARMPLFDHLGELRMRLVRIIACLAIAVVVFYMATPIIRPEPPRYTLDST